MATLWVAAARAVSVRRFRSGWYGAGPPAFPAARSPSFWMTRATGALYVGLSHGHFGCKLHRSDDRGVDMGQLPAPAFPKSEADDAPAVELLGLQPGGGISPECVWRDAAGWAVPVDDRGETWVLKPAAVGPAGKTAMDGGVAMTIRDPFDHRGPARPGASGAGCLTAAGSWITRDGGRPGSMAAMGLRSDYVPPGMEQTRCAGPASDRRLPRRPGPIWCQHHCGIFVSIIAG